MSDPIEIIKNQMIAEKLEKEARMISKLEIMSDNKTCDSCTYFYTESVELSKDKISGICWRYPPVPMDGKATSYYLRPMVMNFHFCGEHKEK